MITLSKMPPSAITRSTTPTRGGAQAGQRDRSRPEGPDVPGRVAGCARRGRVARRLGLRQCGVEMALVRSGPTRTLLARAGGCSSLRRTSAGHCRGGRVTHRYKRGGYRSHAQNDIRRRPNASVKPGSEQRAPLRVLGTPGRPRGAVLESAIPPRCHERLGGQIFRPHRPLGAQGMAVRKHRHYRVCVEQQLALEIGMRQRDVEQPEVELPRPQALDLLQRGDMRDLELKARLTRGEGGQESLQSVERHGRRRADPHHRPRPRGTSGFGHGVLERSQHAPRLAGERRPRPGLGRQSGWCAEGAGRRAPPRACGSPARGAVERSPGARPLGRSEAPPRPRGSTGDVEARSRGHTSPNGSESSDSPETLGPLCRGG